MKKVFKLEDLDCANCAAKMQRAIGDIDGVTGVNVNFMTQRLTLEADDAIFDSVLDKAAKTIRKIEPDCKIVR